VLLRCTHAQNHKRWGRAVDRKAFEVAIQNNLSPHGVAAVIAMLQTADHYRRGTPANEAAFTQAVWLRETLLGMLGVVLFNHLIEEIGL
jgi:hypothetical protein